MKLRTLNRILLGLILGSLLSLSLLSLIPAPKDSLLALLLRALGPILGLYVFLFSKESFVLSIPFIRLQEQVERTRHFLLDESVLVDGRLADLATLGLFDQRLIVPRFLLSKLSLEAESSDESVALRAKHGLETVNRLSSLPELALRIHEADFPELKEFSAKVVRLARSLEADLLSAETGSHAPAGVRTLNLHTLAQALKAPIGKGETLRIKIQRLGKEEGQGVGYLEDGSMVVVNGGSEYLGEGALARVLSVKCSTTGRMIFCNLIESEL